MEGGTFVPLIRTSVLWKLEIGKWGFHQTFSEELGRMEEVARTGVDFGCFLICAANRSEKARAANGAGCRAAQYARLVARTW
jgi:hypothetical protein